MSKYLFLAFFSALILFLFSSCIFLEFDSNYDVVGIASWVWWALGIFAVVFIVAGISGKEKLDEVNRQLEKMDLMKDDLKNIGSYVGGHPEINDAIEKTSFVSEDKQISLYDMGSGFEVPVLKASISKDEIKDVTIEDSSSIENKITVGRLFLVGIFALAWKKKKKNELAFVVITWNDGKFDHNTTFSFEGEDAMKKANTARNELIKVLR